jgi:hypothetical protein
LNRQREVVVDIASSTLFNIISLALGVLGVLPLLIAGPRSLRRFYKVQRVLRLQRGNRLDLVLTTSSITQSSHGKASAMRPVTAEGELIGIAEVATVLGAHYPHKEVCIQVSARVRNRLDRDLIILGGPAANQHASDYLEAADIAIAHNIIYDASNCHVRMNGTDINDFNIDLKEGLPRKDLVLIIVGPNPFSQMRARSVLCAGLTTYGTGAAAQLLFRDVLQAKGPEAHKLRRHFRRRSVAALVECRLDAGRLLYWKLVEVVSE